MRTNSKWAMALALIESLLKSQVITLCFLPLICPYIATLQKTIAELRLAQKRDRCQQAPLRFVDFLRAGLRFTLVTTALGVPRVGMDLREEPDSRRH